MNIKDQKGSALVEAAIILPLLLAVVFGIFEFGRAMYITNTLNNAAREGARRAAVTPAPININQFVINAIPLNRTGLVITTTPTAPASGTSVTVTVTLPFRSVTRLIPMLNNVTLRGSATMRYEL